MRVLGIDYGRRRIGLALSDPTGLLARPWKTLEAPGNTGQAAEALVLEVERLLLEDGGLGRVVLGYPRRLGGEANAQTAEVEALAGMLRERLAVPLVLQDERLTSREAESLLARRIGGWRERKRRLDAMAAAVILQDYLDGQPQRTAHMEADTE